MDDELEPDREVTRVPNDGEDEPKFRGLQKVTKGTKALRPRREQRS